MKPQVIPGLAWDLSSLLSKSRMSMWLKSVAERKKNKNFGIIDPCGKLLLLEGTEGSPGNINFPCPLQPTAVPGTAFGPEPALPQRSFIPEISKRLPHFWLLPHAKLPLPPPTDCCPCFWTRACPPPNEFVPENFKESTSFLTTSSCKTASGSSILYLEHHIIFLILL